MPNFAYQLNFTADLDVKPQVQRIVDKLFMTDSEADTIIVTLMKSGEVPILSGGVVAKMLLSDDTLLTWQGTRSNTNVLSATLPVEAYAVPGMARFTMQLVNDTEAITVFCADIVIAHNGSVNEVTPAGAVPDLTTLLGVISDCEAATAAAEAAVAALPDIATVAETETYLNIT